MAKVFFFSDLRPQAPFSSLAAAAVEAALRAVARVAVRLSSLEVALTAMMLFYYDILLKLTNCVLFQIVLLDTDVDTLKLITNIKLSPEV